MWGHPAVGLQGRCGPITPVPSLKEPRNERRAHLWPQVTAWPQGRAPPHPWNLDSQSVWGKVVGEHFPFLGCSKGDLLLHSWGAGTGKCRRWDKQEKKMREKREKSDHVPLSAFTSGVGNSPGPGYLRGICPSALPVQSHKGPVFPSLSEELGCEKIAGEADTTGEVKEKKTQPPLGAQLSPLCPTAILPCQSFPGWALRAPGVTGQGDGSTGREQGKAEDSAFPCGMCWAGFGLQPEVVMSKPWGCDNSSSLGFQVAARAANSRWLG